MRIQKYVIMKDDDQKDGNQKERLCPMSYRAIKMKNAFASFRIQDLKISYDKFSWIFFADYVLTPKFGHVPQQFLFYLDVKRKSTGLQRQVNNLLNFGWELINRKYLSG